MAATRLYGLSLGPACGGSGLRQAAARDLDVSFGAAGTWHRLSRAAGVAQRHSSLQSISQARRTPPGCVLLSAEQVRSFGSW